MVKKNPTDKLSQSQLEICSKIVKKNAFLKAIEIADPPSADAGLDLDGMVVEASYTGAELGEEMTQEFIDDMIARFRDQKTLHRKYVYRIVLKVKEILDKEPTMVEVEIPKGHTLTVCGDTHGKPDSWLEFQLTLRQASTSTCSRYSAATATPPRRTTTSSTATSSTAAPGRPRSRSSSTRTSGCTRPASTSTAATTRRTT